jgi:oligopeptidase B
MCLRRVCLSACHCSVAEGCFCAQTHLVVHERRGGAVFVRVVPLDGAPAWDALLPPEALAVEAGANLDSHATVCRLQWSSPLVPHAEADLDLRTQRVHVCHRASTRDINPDHYITDRTAAVSPDGTRVPVTVISHRTTPRDRSCALCSVLVRCVVLTEVRPDGRCC